MKFPEWVDDPHQSNTERAGARLRYILKTASLHLTGDGTMRSIARMADVDHSTMAAAVKRGWFSIPMANKIQEAVGRDHLKCEHLTHPLEIES